MVPIPSSAIEFGDPFSGQIKTIRHTFTKKLTLKNYLWVFHSCYHTYSGSHPVVRYRIWRPHSGSVGQLLGQPAVLGTGLLLLGDVRANILRRRGGLGPRFLNVREAWRRKQTGCKCKHSNLNLYAGWQGCECIISLFFLN